MTEVQKELHGLGNQEKAKILQRFFKTGPGEYAEGDRFIGVTVPKIRKLSRQYRQLDMQSTEKLLRSDIHEERMLALFILVLQYGKASDEEKEKIFKLYLKNTRFINNWDLVDTSAEHIVGNFLASRKKTPLYALARSRSLWERRIAILSTFHYIKHRQFSETLKISKILLNDEHDLIHKAVGWMLREVGDRDLETEEKFLKTHYHRMPRTMLRYAIEKFPEGKRQRYLKGTA